LRKNKMAERVLDKIIVRKKKKVKKDNKTSKLMTGIAILSAILIVLIFVTFFVFRELTVTINEGSLKMKNLQKHNLSLINQISDLENKSVVAKKFINIWRDDLTDIQKSKDGISINNATELLKKVSKDHNISNLQINFSNPAVLMGDFEKNSIKVNSTLITIKFDTISDINVLNFVRDFESKIPNFMLLTSLDVVRTEKINEEYFESLKKRKVIPTLRVELKIRWYGITSNNE